MENLNHLIGKSEKVNYLQDYFKGQLHSNEQRADVGKEVECRCEETQIKLSVP
jgi:hypothetical protein